MVSGMFIVQYATVVLSVFTVISKKCVNHVSIWKSVNTIEEN